MDGMVNTVKNDANNNDNSNSSSYGTKWSAKNETQINTVNIFCVEQCHK